MGGSLPGEGQTPAAGNHAQCLSSTVQERLARPERQLVHYRTYKTPGRADSFRSPHLWKFEQGEWKLRWQFKPYGKGAWELFNVAKDPAERKDLAAQNPDKVKALLAVWDGYVKANNVILPSRGPFETLEDQLPQRVPVEAGFPPLIYKRQFVPPKEMLADPK